MPIAPRVPPPYLTQPIDAQGYFDRAWLQFFDQFSKTSQATVQYGSHTDRANQLASTFPDGSTWTETDRNNLVYQVRNGVWAYLSGTLELEQSKILALQASLGVADTGLILKVIDFAHVLEWSGTGFIWGLNDTGGGYIRGFLVDPNPMTGWALCNGALEITYLNPDGSLSKTTLPDLANQSAYLKLGNTGVGLVMPAIAPKFQGDKYTPQGVNSQPALFLNGPTSPYSIAGTIAAITPTGTIGASSGLNSVPGGTSGTFFDCASAGHTHSLTMNAVTPVWTCTPFIGSVSAPIFTGTAKAPTGLITPDGEPQNVVLRAFFRR